MVTLAANNEFQELLLAHLNTLTNPAVIIKINNGKKTLDGCQSFITNEMRKRQKNGVAVASDDEVYGLAVHYFQEDEIPESEVKHHTPVKSRVVDISKSEREKWNKAADVKKSDGQIEGQLSLF